MQDLSLSILDSFQNCINRLSIRSCNRSLKTFSNFFFPVIKCEVVKRADSRTEIASEESSPHPPARPRVLGRLSKVAQPQTTPLFALVRFAGRRAQSTYPQL